MKILCLLLRFNKDGFTYDPDSTEKVTNYLLPLGLAYISAVLKQAGKEVTVLNLNNREGLVKTVIRNEMIATEYDVVFLGGLSLFYPHIRDIISYIREYSPKTKIVVGGGIMTAQPEVMFDLLKPDFGVIGEGEKTVLELVDFIEDEEKHCGVYHHNINGIKGVVFKAFRMPEAKEKICITAPREPILDLNTLPFPDYESFGYADYLNRIKPTDYIAYDVVDEPRFYPVLASRSCPFNCTFCFHPLGQKYRQRSVDNIMDEIKINVKKHRINIVFIYDELFSHDRERMIDFCTKFKAFSDTLPYKLWFYCNNRVDSTTDEMLKIMKNSGAYLLSFGLESYSQTVLDSLKKHTTPEQIDKIVRLLRENKLGLQGSFIFGDIAETRETANETINYLKSNRRSIGAGVSVGFIILFQGTPLYKQYLKLMKITDETQFIKDRENKGIQYTEPINITTMPDNIFMLLQEKILELELVVDEIYSVPEKEWVMRGITYTQTKCPSCGEISTFVDNPTPVFGQIKNVGCRHCNYRFYMASSWYPLKKEIIKTIGIGLSRAIMQQKRKLL